MSKAAITVSMPAGTAITLEVPVDAATGDGHFPLETDDSKVTVNGVDRDLVLGFAVEFPDVGGLETIPESVAAGELKVKYTQLKAGENRIHFFTSTGLTQTVSIVTIPLHDHSTIVQGGPAYGTYFSAYTPEDTQNPQN